MRRGSYNCRVRDPRGVNSARDIPIKYPDAAISYTASRIRETPISSSESDKFFFLNVFIKDQG